MYAKKQVAPVLLWGRRRKVCDGILGVTSYPLYTVHVPIVSVIRLTVRRIAGGRIEAWAPWFGLGIIVIVVVLSWLLATTYDGWARRKLTQFFKIRGRGVSS